MSQSHQFSLFVPHALQASRLQSDAAVHLADSEVAHRIYRVLRLRQEECLVFFDRDESILVRLLERSGKGVSFAVLERIPHPQPRVAIHAVLPLLKREALDAAVYALTQAGAHTVQLVHSKRSHSIPKGVKFLERLERVAVAAAEQSKQYLLPAILAPVSLQEAFLQVRAPLRLYASVSGTPIGRMQLAQDVAVCCGPEGGFVDSEEQLLLQHDFQACSLIDSVMRAEQAMALLAWTACMGGATATVL